MLEQIFTKEIYGIVVTNSYFSQNATELAEKIGIVLWDRNTLRQILTSWDNE